MNTGKGKIRKLQLNRETLMPLDSTDLEDVNGGASTGDLVRSAVRASQNYCSRISRAAWSAVEKLSISYSAYEATRAITRTSRAEQPAPPQGGNSQGGGH
jgi:hypothetical protein